MPAEFVPYFCVMLAVALSPLGLLFLRSGTPNYGRRFSEIVEHHTHSFDWLRPLVGQDAEIIPGECWETPEPKELRGNDSCARDSQASELQ